MIRLFSIIVILFFGLQLQSQITSDNDCGKIYNIVDSMPQFPGGDIAFSHFIRDLEYPENCTVHDLEYVKFIINKEGKATAIEAVGFKDLCAEAIENQFAKMPKWTPGYLKDSAVCILQAIPIYKPNRKN
ncbi:MAG: hypothetical protein WD048_10975 [Chitinophagales bacterium]